jgi:transposase InsO family protein
LSFVRYGLNLSKNAYRFSRRIVGWDLQDHMRETLVLAAAIRARQRRRA